VGFAKQVGLGQAIMLGASLTAHKLEDLDILHQFGVKMGCQPLFALDVWADVRISRGERGNFLFIANYQDDPVSPHVIYDGLTLFNGYPVYLPARRGMILPINWQISKDVALDYATCEVTEISDEGCELIIKTQEPEFDAQLTLTRYRCDLGTSITFPDGRTRVSLHVTDGMIVLHKC
jgi:beta-galactosidase